MHKIIFLMSILINSSVIGSQNPDSLTKTCKEIREKITLGELHKQFAVHKQSIASLIGSHTVYTIENVRKIISDYAAEDHQYEITLNTDYCALRSELKDDEPACPDIESIMFSPTYINAFTKQYKTEERGIIFQAPDTNAYLLQWHLFNDSFSQHDIVHNGRYPRNNIPAEITIEIPTNKKNDTLSYFHTIIVLISKAHLIKAAFAQKNLMPIEETIDPQVSSFWSCIKSWLKK